MFACLESWFVNQMIYETNEFFENVIAFVYEHLYKANL